VNALLIPRSLARIARFARISAAPALEERHVIGVGLDHFP
jgi:hypothetical protein